MTWLSFRNQSLIKRSFIANNIAFDSELLEEAVIVGHHKSKKEAINAALKEYVMRRKQLKIIDFFGDVDWDNYDYKKARKKR